MSRAALLSVSDRAGIVEFAQALQQLGYQLLSTGGTGKHLSQNGVAITAIEDYTQQKEILDGRVKTLHPKVHAGILARRDDAGHMAQLASDRTAQIDLVVVNLYPFSEKVRGESARDPAAMIEYIDVGGPTMLRAAAKNFKSVFAVCDPQDYARVIECLRSGKRDSREGLELRRELACKVFALLAKDNSEVASYLAGVEANQAAALECTAGEVSVQAGAALWGMLLQRRQTLRYGENPAQKAWSYIPWGQRETSWTQFAGKELSYNNLLDCDAAFRLLRDFRQGRPVAFIIKHLNPCGVAAGETTLQALTRAKLCDPRSHFGGIIGFNRTVSEEVADNIREDFAEIVVAPDYEPKALALLQRNKNLRLIRYDLEAPGCAIEIRAIQDGFLLQEPDHSASTISDAGRVTGEAPSSEVQRDLAFAWKICAHVKSNAIVLVNDTMTIGVGAGQMSRIDALELAISKAKTHGHSLRDCVCASDAFFPFPDSIEKLSEIGARAVIAPSGAKRDEEIVQLAQRLGLTLLFAKDRHFRH